MCDKRTRHYKNNLTSSRNDEWKNFNSNVFVASFSSKFKKVWCHVRKHFELWKFLKIKRDTKWGNKSHQIFSIIMSGTDKGYLWALVKNIKMGCKAEGLCVQVKFSPLPFSLAEAFPMAIAITHIGKLSYNRSWMLWNRRGVYMVWSLELHHSLFAFHNLIIVKSFCRIFPSKITKFSEIILKIKSNSCSTWWYVAVLDAVTAAIANFCIEQ